MKISWWRLTIEDYPNYKPNDIDLEHIAEKIKEGYDQGQLIQEDAEESKCDYCGSKNIGHINNDLLCLECGEKI